jgi:hypothetical protein
MNDLHERAILVELPTPKDAQKQSDFLSMLLRQVESRYDDLSKIDKPSVYVKSTIKHCEKLLKILRG